MTDTKTKPRKIISGGQTGADQGGLEGAQAIGMETGGWMPRGWRTERGSQPEVAHRFGMHKTKSRSYPPRTLKNVKDSDGTMIVGNPKSRGSMLTSAYCSNEMKPILRVMYAKGDLSAMVYQVSKLQDFVSKNKIEVLNVAGNRESTQPGIQEFTKDLIVRAFGGEKKYEDH